MLKVIFLLYVLNKFVFCGFVCVFPNSEAEAFLLNWQYLSVAVNCFLKFIFSSSFLFEYVYCINYMYSYCRFEQFDIFYLGSQNSNFASSVAD